MGVSEENGKFENDSLNIEEGVVHGHIHNYNNMTYIHGHIHHNVLQGANATNLEEELSESHHHHDIPQTRNPYIIPDDGDNLNIEDLESLRKKFVDCQHFEFMDFKSNFPEDFNFSFLNTNTAHNDISYKDSLLNNPQPPLNNLLNHDFTNNKTRRDSLISLNDDILNLPLSKRRRAQSIDDSEKDCCSPKVFEVCCDVDHYKDNNTKDNTIGVENVSLNTTQNYSQSDFNQIPVINQYIPNQSHVTSQTYHNKFPEVFHSDQNELLSKNIFDINCDLTCEPLCSNDETHHISNTIKQETSVIKLESTTDITSNSNDTEEEDIFDKFCKECERIGQINDMNKKKSEKMRHKHFHDSVSTTPRMSDSTDIFIKNENENDNELYHEHISNKQVDLKILKDLCNISSLYEIPLATHMNHHHHHSHLSKTENHDSSIDRSESLNLLQPLINTKSENIFHKNNNHDQTPPEQNNQSLPHHHHHTFQIHSHDSNEIMTNQNDRSVSYERFKKDYKDSSNKNDNNLSNTIVEDSNINIKLYHQNEHKIHSRNTIDPGSTINFNWNFRSNDQNANSIKCKWQDCDNAYHNLIDLQKHLFKDHITQYDLPFSHTGTSVPIKGETCKWDSCDFKTNNICSIVNHINDEHGLNFDMKFIDSNSTNFNKAEELMGQTHHAYHCSNSDCHTSNKPNNTPLITNTSKAPFVCKWENCNENFQSEKDLNNHLERIHLPSGQHSYKCYWNGCFKNFTQRQKIVRHLKVHSGYKPFKCVECSKLFSTKETLNQHMRTHSGEKPYKCTICGKSFAASPFLNIHIRTHTGEKPLACPHCPKRFRESSNLNKHIKTHLKAFKCDVCKKSFDTQDKFDKHLTSCH